MADAPEPVARADAASRGRRARVLGVDAARALAIIGMVTVNVGPTDATEAGAKLYLIPHGRASILFVLLAGIGFSLMTRRVRQYRDAGGLPALWASLGWRCGVLLLGGLALQRLGHGVNVILAVYALLFLLAGVLVRARDWVLLVIAGLGVSVGPALWLTPQLERDTSFDGSAPQLGDPLGEVLISISLSGPYPLVTWIGPFALGMWLGRRDLTSPALQRRLLIGAAALAVAAALLARGAGWLRGGPVGDLSWELLLTDAPHGQMPLWLLGASAVSVLILAACLALERRLGQRVLRPLVPLGQLALTFYVGHLVVLAWLRPLPHTLAQGVALSAALVVVAAVASALWLRRYRRGPLEILIRAPWTWRQSARAREEGREESASRSAGDGPARGHEEPPNRSDGARPARESASSCSPDGDSGRAPPVPR